MITSTGTPASPASMLTLIRGLSGCTASIWTGAKQNRRASDHRIARGTDAAAPTLLAVRVYSALACRAPRALPRGLLPRQLRKRNGSPRCRGSQTPAAQGLFATYQAGGVGLNIQSATVVVLFDRWWNRPSRTRLLKSQHQFGRRLLARLPVLCADSSRNGLNRSLQSRERHEHALTRLKRLGRHRGTNSGILGLSVAEVDGTTGQDRGAAQD